MEVGRTEFVIVEINVCEAMSLVDGDGNRKVVTGNHTLLVGSSNEAQVRHQIDVRLSQSGNGGGEDSMIK